MHVGGTPRALSTLSLGSGSTDRHLWRDFLPRARSLAFRHACKMGLKELSRSDWDRVTVWAFSRLVEVQEPIAPAVKREAEEEWR